MKISASKKIFLSLVTSAFLASSLSAYQLPNSFFELPKDKQKEILLDNVKLKAYLAKHGLVMEDKKEKKAEAPKKKKFSYIPGSLMTLEEAIKENNAPAMYEGPTSFDLKLISGHDVKVNLGYGNGANLITPRKVKIEIKNAKITLPNGKVEVADNFVTYLEESECEIATFEVENALMRKDLRANEKFAAIPLALISGVLYMDIDGANGITVDLSVPGEIEDVDTEGLKSKSPRGLDLTDAEFIIKER